MYASMRWDIFSSSQPLSFSTSRYMNVNTSQLDYKEFATE
jgi:hypothetical protein